MPCNLELKTRLDDWERLQIVLPQIATAGPFQLRQVDTYFQCHHGRLKCREEEGTGSTLIWYQRTDTYAIRPSQYYIVPLDAAGEIKHLLTKALQQEVTVAKIRQLWWFHNVRIHVDQVTSLGSFIELEGVLSASQSEAITQDRMCFLIDRLDLHQLARIPESYRELMLAIT